MPRRVELDLALGGLALARNWLVGDPETVARILEEVRRLAMAASDDWFEAPERPLADGYAEWSGTYDQAPNPIVQLEAPALRAILEELEAGTALDAACGTGRHAAVLHELGHRVVGVDASAAMLERARKRVPAGEFVRAELTSLPFDAGAFDAAVCALALTHVAHPVPAIAELARVLRPDGRLVISDVHPLWVALGAQAAYRDEGGEMAYVRNYVHWPGVYLRAFRTVGLDVLACHELLYGRSEIDLWVDRVALDGEVVAAALEGLAAVIVWDLACRAA